MPIIGFSQNTYQIAVLKYNGGGDWYANPSSLPNLLQFIDNNTSIVVNLEEKNVKVGDTRGTHIYQHEYHKDRIPSN